MPDALWGERRCSFLYDLPAFVIGSQRAGWETGQNPSGRGGAVGEDEFCPLPGRFPTTYVPKTADCRKSVESRPLPVYNYGNDRDTERTEREQKR